MSNINTLKSMKEKDSKADESDDNQQAFYAGGSDRSGQEILGPPTPRNSDDIIRDIFKSAKDAGAQQLEHEDDDYPPSPPVTFPGRFDGNLMRLAISTTPTQSTSNAHTRSLLHQTKGQGFRLDSHPGQSSQASASGAETKKEKKPVLRKLKLWKNGFSIDDGELRDYNTPENAEFLASVKKGEVPRELVNETRSPDGPSSISINITNRR